MKSIIDRIFGTETRVEKSNASELKPVEYLLPPIIESMFDPVKYNIEEDKENTNLHDRIEWRKQNQKKSFYNL